jgi:hypothetical protein
MLARVFSCAIIGLDDVVVEVTGQGLPAIIILGLPDTAVQESRERIQMAIKNAGLIFPRKRITYLLSQIVRHCPARRKIGFIVHVEFIHQSMLPAWGIFRDFLNNPLIVKRPTRAGRLSHLSPNLSQGYYKLP